jgi:hypothetical protein
MFILVALAVVGGVVIVLHATWRRLTEDP